MGRPGPPARATAPGAVLLVLLATCTPKERTPAPTSDAVVVTDASGREVSLPGPVRRIVSLVPSATSTLDAIGAAELLVGRTDYDTQAWTSDIPSVGGGLEPSVEAIVALEPDIVLRFEGDQDPGTRGRLEDLGIRYANIDPESLQDIFETTEILGRLTGREAESEALIARLRTGLAEVEAAVAEWPRLRFVYVLGGTPPWVSGPGTYIEELLTLAGGDNVFSDLGTLYASVSPEELRSREIDVVLVSSREAFDSDLTPDARVVEVGAILELPGPHVVAAIREVAARMHGRELP